MILFLFAIAADGGCGADVHGALGGVFLVRVNGLAEEIDLGFIVVPFQ